MELQKTTLPRTIWHTRRLCARVCSQPMCSVHSVCQCCTISSYPSCPLLQVDCIQDNQHPMSTVVCIHNCNNYIYCKQTDASIHAVNITKTCYKKIHKTGELITDELYHQGLHNAYGDASRSLRNTNTKTENDFRHMKTRQVRNQLGRCTAWMKAELNTADN